MSNIKSNEPMNYEEIQAKSISGITMLVLNILLLCVSIVAIIAGIIMSDNPLTFTQGMFYIVLGFIYSFIVSPTLFLGLKVLKPNEALVLTLFGKYYGTLRHAGYYFVNPFVVAMNPSSENTTTGSLAKTLVSPTIGNVSQQVQYHVKSKKISLKTMTLNNDKQKVNDSLGNPIIIGIVVVWKVVNTAEAVFNVDNYTEFLSIQCDSSLRNIVRLYPYDSSGTDDETSLRGSNKDIAEKLKNEIQEKVKIAGIEIIEAKITHLSYSPEIASAMLQRQQASAIIDARQMIVEGAVGMVEMALAKLNENDIVHLDEERKAAMVSNLLVVLCGNKDAQPIVNSGSIY